MTFTGLAMERSTMLFLWAIHGYVSHNQRVYISIFWPIRNEQKIQKATLLCLKKPKPSNMMRKATLLYLDDCVSWHWKWSNQTVMAWKSGLLEGFWVMHSTVLWWFLFFQGWSLPKSSLIALWFPVFLSVFAVFVRAPMFFAWGPKKLRNWACRLLRLGWFVQPTPLWIVVYN